MYGEHLWHGDAGQGEDSCPGRAKQDMRDFITLFRRVHNSKLTIIYSGIFHLMFSEHSCLWVTKITESKTTDEGEGYR